MASLRVDHVNYLIWRYLQECGLGKTAVQLMREWNREPQELPFAQSVKANELVSILQDGLAYDEILSQVKSNDRRYSFLEQRKPSRGGEVADGQEADVVDEEAAARSRKRPKLDRAGSDVRKKRASSGKQASTDDAMDVDGEDFSTKLKVEEPPLVSTAALGSDKGVQSKPIYKPANAEEVACYSLQDADVLNLSWCLVAGKEQLLATGGNICRTLDINGNADVEAKGKDVSWMNIVGQTVSSSAVDASGTQTAAALDLSSDGSSKIFVAKCSDGHDLPQKTDMREVLGETVILIRWSPSGKSLMFALHSQADDDPNISSSSTAAMFPLDDTGTSTLKHQTDQPTEDATWIDDESFIICGQNLLQLIRVEEGALTVRSTIETTELWSNVSYDCLSRRACCISPEDGTIAILNVSAHEISFLTKEAHGSQITGMEWQPSAALAKLEQQPTGSHLNASDAAPEPNRSGQREDEAATDGLSASMEQDEQDQAVPPSNRTLATAALDGTIKLWTATADLSLSRTLIMDTAAPAMALAFSPDGKYVAAAGDDRICIWLVNEGEEARSDYYRKDQQVAIWTAAAVSQEDEEKRVGWPIEDAPFHVLAWSRRGDMMAYSSGNRVSHQA